MFNKLNNLSNEMTDGGFIDFLKKLIAKFKVATAKISTNSTAKTSQSGPRLTVAACVSGCLDGL